MRASRTYFKPLDNERVEGAGDEEHVGDRLPIADGDQRAIQAGRSEANGEQDQKRLKLVVVFRSPACGTGWW